VAVVEQHLVVLRLVQELAGLFGLVLGYRDAERSGHRGRGRHAMRATIVERPVHAVRPQELVYDHLRHKLDIGGKHLNQCAYIGGLLPGVSLLPISVQLARHPDSFYLFDDGEMALVADSAPADQGPFAGADIRSGA
jgi:hypothetical protein